MCVLATDSLIPEAVIKQEYSTDGILKYKGVHFVLIPLKLQTILTVKGNKTA